MDLNDYEENDLFEDQFPEGNAPQGPENNGSNNRAFIIGIAALGGVVVLAIIAMIVYVLFFRPKTSADLQNQAAQIQAQNTAISLIATQTAEFNDSHGNSKSCTNEYTNCAFSNISCGCSNRNNIIRSGKNFSCQWK